MIFLDRSKKGTTPHLAWRVRVFWGGAALALVGFYLGASWLIWIAIGVLLGGFFVRYLPGRDKGLDPGEEEITDVFENEA